MIVRFFVVLAGIAIVGFSALVVATVIVSSRASREEEESEKWENLQ